MQQTTMSTAFFLLRLLCCCFRFAEKQEDAATEYQKIETQTQTSAPLSSGTSSRSPLETIYDADSENSNEEDGYFMVKRASDHKSDSES